ncbi:hypothetical protein MTsPCn5_27790 [Croceitalea sp. MTPC5]|nr:hypothetical protein MTsPCn5_27790 [Croceitalea sp. MTPC5]
MAELVTNQNENLPILKNQKYMKSIKSTSLGIILAWIVLIAFGFYKSFETDIIVLFIALAVITSSSPFLIKKLEKKNRSDQ